MATVRIPETIDSGTLTLPELKPLAGEADGNVVRERNGVVVTPGTGNWKALEEAASNLEGYDFEAWRLQRERDQRDELETLP